MPQQTTTGNIPNSFSKLSKKESRRQLINDLSNEIDWVKNTHTRPTNLFTWHYIQAVLLFVENAQ